METDKLISIILMFENCDECVIRPDQIGMFFLDEVCESIFRDLDIGIPDINRTKKCSTFCLEICSEDNFNFKEFGQEGWERPLFSRICETPDIVGVELHWESGRCELIEVPYDEDRAGTNKCQHCWVSDKGDLYVVITENSVTSESILNVLQYRWAGFDGDDCRKEFWRMVKGGCDG